MKKITFTLLMLVLLLTLVGCGHKHEYTDEVVAPTCTEKGYTKHTCECGDTYNDSEVDAKGHSYGEWVVVKEATEEAAGSKERVCSVCGNKETETIAKLDHTHKYTDTVVEPTCTEDGYTEHKCECGHSYKDNEVKASHKEEVIEGKEATCTEDGLTEGKKCSVCNEVLVEQEIVEATGHEYGDWKVTKEPTYTQVGTREKECTHCGDKITEDVPVKADPNEGKTFDKITLNGTTYAKLEEAIKAANNGDIIYLPSGTYSDAITINKSVTLKGSNVAKNPNTEQRKSESKFTGVITLAASDITIDGIALSGKGQINTKENTAVKNITIKNVHAYSISCDSTWIDSDRDYAQNYVMNIITTTYGNISNVNIINCKFNTREGGIKFGRVDDVTVQGNTFTNFENGAIRIEGGYNAGTFTFKDNKFENDKVQGYFGIYFSSYGGSNKSCDVVIDNNTFKNIGADTGTYIGAINSKSYQEKGSNWIITNNTFENCKNYMLIRNNASSTNHAKYPWTLKAENNTFIGEPEGVYYNCRINASDSATTNPSLAVFDKNTFKDASGNVITPSESKLLNIAEKINEEDGYLIGEFENNSWVVKGENIQLLTTYVESTLNELAWKSENPEIATVSSNGTVTGVSEGVASIVVYDSKNPEISFTFYVTVFNENPTGLLEFLVNNNNANVFTKDDLIIGIITESGYYYADIMGSVSKLLFEDYVVHEDHYLEDPKNKSTLTGENKTGIDFITFHYAADMPYSATASLKGGSNLASYNKTCNTNNIQASWHFSTGNDGVWACQNTAYGAWHAGSSKAMKWYPSGVKTSDVGTDIYTTDVTLGTDNYFYLKGKKTTVQNTTGQTTLNGMGLGVKLVGDEWYISGCYYNSSYKYISAVGGNNNSIGIESSVREGSDLWLTWQYSAQLCASLLLKNELPIQRLVGHHFFSGKWCPQPMLENDLEIWYEFVELVKAEMTLFKDYSNCQLSFSSDSKYLGDNGRITTQPTFTECVTYTVNYTVNGETKSVTLSSIVPGKLK